MVSKEEITVFVRLQKTERWVEINADVRTLGMVLNGWRFDAVKPLSVRAFKELENEGVTLKHNVSSEGCYNVKA